ncbi:MAG: ATP-binding cassette domain-containing protein, partial [Sphingomonadales bacterium]
MAGDAKITLEGVSKAFGSNHVLDGVDLEVVRGESLAIIGQSGSGKSVTLKCILGLIRPDSPRMHL